MQMFTGAKFGSKSAAKSKGFDPDTKTGLLPKTDGTASINGSVTYVIGGSSTSASSLRRRGKLNGRSDGLSLSRFEEAREERDREDAKVRAKRQRLEEAEMVKMLDGEKKTGVGSVGGKYVEQARRVREEAKRKEESKKAKSAKGKAPTRPSVKRHDEEDKGETEEKVKKRKAFSAAAVRAIGFDPTRRSNHHRGQSSSDGEAKGQAKEEATRDLLEGRKDRHFDVDELAFPEGERRRRSGVSAPKQAVDESDEDDLVIEPKRRVRLRPHDVFVADPTEQSPTKSSG